MTETSNQYAYKFYKQFQISLRHHHKSYEIIQNILNVHHYFVCTMQHLALKVIKIINFELISLTMQ